MTVRKHPIEACVPELQVSLATAAPTAGLAKQSRGTLQHVRVPPAPLSRAFSHNGKVLTLATIEDHMQPQQSISRPEFCIALRYEVKFVFAILNL